MRSDLITSENISNKFLNGTIPIVGYIKNDIFHIDLKAIPNNQVDELINMVNKVLK